MSALSAVLIIFLFRFLLENGKMINPHSKKGREGRTAAATSGEEEGTRTEMEKERAAKQMEKAKADLEKEHQEHRGAVVSEDKVLL